MYQRNEDTWKGYAREHKGDYEREDGITGYAWIARYTLQFLDAYLKHDLAAMTFLKKTPAENGVPKHFMSVTVRPAKGKPASFETFRAEMARQGFDHAPEVYAAMQKETADFKLEEFSLNAWARELEAENHLPEATALLKLNVQNNPASFDALDSLGEAYTRSGQKQLAIESYDKALEKNPADQNAKDKLEELGVNPPEGK